MPWYRRRGRKKNLENALQSIIPSIALGARNRDSSTSSSGSGFEHVVRFNTDPDTSDNEANIKTGNSSAEATPNTEGRRKFSDAVTKVIAARRLEEGGLVPQVLEGEEVRDCWPATAAWFLGPKAENLSLLKTLVTKAIDEHADYRKYKYFPLDPKYVTKSIEKEPAFIAATEALRDNLDQLCDRLKNSVPFSSFRSQGHMLWDTTIASNVGYIAALLYNQNNVASMASGVTLELEREVAMDLCRMVGYNTDTEAGHTTERPLAWGHLPNGGTVANLEAMWAARSVKFNGLTMQKMLNVRRHANPAIQYVYENFTFETLLKEQRNINAATAWELLNLPIDEGIDLFDKLVDAINEREAEMGSENVTTVDTIFDWVKEFTLEELGGLNFYELFQEELRGISIGGRWFCPGSRHYSWDKGANILGIGRRNLIKIPVDINCRLDTEVLKRELEHCLEKRIPVIGVTVVVGTTQEGAVDDLKTVLEIREELEAQGLTFTVHIDGAWGGYFASCVDNIQDEEVRSQGRAKMSVSAEKSFFFNETRVSEHFETQLRCLKRANSITLDPHKSGFCPYPAGGLLYRNGNIRKFLAQKAAYVNHGTKKNEEINLFGIDGSKPGAASAGVWLSHKVTGLGPGGYGLLLRQSSFSASVMYAMWVSLGRSRDPFLIVPGIPINSKYRDKWSHRRIRREILQADNQTLNKNAEALEFLSECGPDTLINCLSVNFRVWDPEAGAWVRNTSMERQREFINKFYKRCSHSYERPYMVDRGIQIILNSTTWEKESHQEVYREMKNHLGLDDTDESKLGVIINTCMTPWLKAQKTFLRMSVIIRNELYNAYGAMTDPPTCLTLVSPNLISRDWDGSLFAELEASFAIPSLRYHAIGKFSFAPEDVEKVTRLAGQCPGGLLRIRTCQQMTVFELMTGGDQGANFINQTNTEEQEDQVDVRYQSESVMRRKSIREKLEKYGDSYLPYPDIAMPEVRVEVTMQGCDEVETVKMKLKRVIRYQHLTRDFVDEADYPPTQEYFLYSDKTTAFLSHCPNRFPDFQQLIQLDSIPVPHENGCETSKDVVLYKEAVERGVVVYLPEVHTGGRPVTKKKNPSVCKDPIKSKHYNAISWSDQGAYTGEMTSIHLRLNKVGVRWFDGKNINSNFEEAKEREFGYLYDSSNTSDYSEEESEDEISS